MTILEAMREPITVQGLVNLVLGIFIGMAFSIAMVAIGGPAIRDAARAQAPVPAASTPCVP